MKSLILLAILAALAVVTLCYGEKLFSHFSVFTFLPLTLAYFYFSSPSSSSSPFLCYNLKVPLLSHFPVFTETDLFY